MSTRKALWNRPAAFAMIVFLFIACSAARLNAQGYASIGGTVTDPSGAVVPAATVTATQAQSGVVSTVKTGGDGNYLFPSLLPASYVIVVSAKGFETYSQTGINLLADSSATINIKLTVGSSSVTVSVVGDAPQVDTSTGTLSQVVDQATVIDMPLNGRNSAQLVTLVAGIVVAPGNGLDQGNTKTFPGQPTVTANGTLPNQSSYLLNGGNNTDEMTNITAPFPFPDALQEFSVQTSNYNAEYGQSAGAVVNIVTKSGGQKFHGDAFEYIRNGYFNSKPYFAGTQTSGSADGQHRHQFGGVIGGPVIIPFISKGKSTQFFFGYQPTIFHQLASGSGVVPIPAAAGISPTGTALGYADFGNLCTGTFTAAGTNVVMPGGTTVNSGSSYCSTASQQIYNPFTGVEYANNRIPASDYDPSSTNFLKGFPLYTLTAPSAGSVSGTVLNIPKPTTQRYDEYLGRVDHSFGDKDHLFGHYYYNHFNQLGVYNPAMLLNYAGFADVRYQNALIAETHTFSSNLLNNLIMNYQREVATRGGPPGGPDITDAPASTTYPGAAGGGFGVHNFWQPTVDHASNMNISNYMGISSSAYAFWSRNNYTFNDDLHWVKGKHNFAVGGHYELSKFDVTNVYQSFGSLASAKAGSAMPIANVDALANFITGMLSNMTQGNYEQVNDRAHFPGAYAQDSWKASPRLTVNYGVRWEQFTPWANRNGAEQEFLPSQYLLNAHTPQYSAASLPAGLMLTGDPGIAPHGVYNKNWQFMPRIGFAYDVKGDGKTVIRGGGGMFYQDRVQGFFNLNQASLQPNTIAVTNINPVANLNNPGGPFSNPYCTRVGGVYTGVCAIYGGTANSGEESNPFPFTLPFPSTKIFPWNALTAATTGTPGMQVFEYPIDGNYKVPVVSDFNLTVEHTLTPSLAIRAAYVGTMSRHLFVSLENNPAVYSATSGLGTNQRRPYNTAPNVTPCLVSGGCQAGYSNIVSAAQIGSGGYNSLQITLDKKPSRGLSFNANITYSKAIDNMPYQAGVNNSEDINVGESYVYPLYPANATNVPAAARFANIKALDHGPSDLDHRIAGSFHYSYELPKVHNGNAILKGLANGWHTSGLVQYHTGDVLTVRAGSDVSQTGLNQDRATRDFSKPVYANNPSGTGNCTNQAHCRNWFNVNAFALPTGPGTAASFGNVNRSSVNGPAYTDWDGAMTRNFQLYKQARMEFRAEYFNMVNHTILNNPNQTVSSGATFGIITGTAHEPRVAQFSLKLLF